MEEARTRTEIGQGNLLREFHDGIADLFHNASDGATGLVGTGAFLIKPFADATDGGQSSFDAPHHFSKADVFGRTGQLISAGDSSSALNQAGRLQVVQYLLEKTLRDILLLCDLRDRERALAVVESQNQECPEGVFTFERKFHGHRVNTPLILSR